MTEQQQDPNKDERGKPDYSLLPWEPIESVINVMMFGAQKYSRDGWMQTKDGRRKYMSAAMRHLVQRFMGRTHDHESGLPHLAHAMCCIMFALWFDARTNGLDEDKKDRIHG